jgi:site-specific DNA-methyltransferase (adenine-specific)
MGVPMCYERVELAGGRAVLYRGDCLQLLEDGMLAGADAVVSDPPYGIGYQHSGKGTVCRLV